VSWLRSVAKNCWLRVLGSVVIQLYAGECTPSVKTGHNAEQSRMQIFVFFGNFETKATFRAKVCAFFCGCLLQVELNVNLTSQTQVKFLDAVKFSYSYTFDHL